MLLYDVPGMYVASIYACRVLLPLLLLPLLLLPLLCVAILLLLLQLVLLAGAVERVPVGIFCWWFIQSDSSSFLMFIQTRFIFSGPLGCTVAYTASICL